MRRVWIAAALMLWAMSVAAQTPSVAMLRVMGEGVSVQRVNTARPLAVSVQAIVGEGDTIITGGEGGALLTMQHGATESVMLEANTVYTLDVLRVSSDARTIAATLTRGQLWHRTPHHADRTHTVRVETPTGHAVTEGGAFAVRLTDDGQLSALSFAGEVQFCGAGIGAGQGGRMEPDGTASDIVLATSFAVLDAALDGCPATLTVFDNLKLPVYDRPRTVGGAVGAVAPSDVARLFGAADNGWYRLRIGDGFGWIRPVEAQVDADCVGLRAFEVDYAEPSETLPTETDPLAWAYCSGETKPPADWFAYTVQAGDNVTRLAERFTTSADRITLYNCIANPNRLTAGEPLFMPSASARR